MKKQNRTQLIATINLTLARMNLTMPKNSDKLNINVLVSLADYARASPELLRLSCEDKKIILEKLDHKKEVKEIKPAARPKPLKGVQLPLFSNSDGG